MIIVSKPTDGDKAFRLPETRVLPSEFITANLGDVATLHQPTTIVHKT